MFWWFRGKKELNNLKEHVEKSFSAVKNDINKVGDWLKHLDGHRTSHKRELEVIKAELSTIKNEIDDIKSLLEISGKAVFKQPFKQRQTAVYKQTAVQGVQTAVQTAVQTGILSSLSTSERAIVWMLLNSELKLSYDDLAAMLGKDRATIRGQINVIKRKSEGLVEEQIEKNGKKRLFIPEHNKTILFKSAKLRVKSLKKRTSLE